MPPETEMVALPVLAPKHPTLVCALTLLLKAAAGCVMVTFCVVMQPLASVMVQMRAPAERLFAVAPVWPGEVFQL